MVKIILFILVYFILGVLTLGITIFLYRKNKVFNEVCKILDFDDIFEAKGDSFVGLCLFYGFFWPLSVLVGIVCFPYAFIKWLDENKWK